MKQGKTLEALAVEVNRQNNVKRDFIADTRKLRVGEGVLPSGEHRRGIHIGDDKFFTINRNCHSQIASWLHIPQQYYDRMKTEAPALLETNVNAWFSMKPEQRMIRTMDGVGRAFLSDRYRPLDNFDLLNAVLPKIAEAGCDIKSCEVTESHLYLKAVCPRIEGEVRKGDVVQAGIVVSNSEVGQGSLKVEPLVYRLVCENGMIVNDLATRKYHVGRRIGDEGNGLDPEEFFRDETRRADDKAFWMKIEDIVDGSLSEAGFGRITQKLREATEEKITRNPLEVVEVVKKEIGLNEDEKGSVLTHLLAGGDLSKYGLANAVTRMAQDVESYDRSTELERAGSSIIELPQTAWNRIALSSLN